jgi:hypothetical protein
VRYAGEIALRLAGPTGKEMRLSDPNISVSRMSDRQVITIFDPMPGHWKLSLNGTGPFGAAATTQSEMYVCCLMLTGGGASFSHPLPATLPVRRQHQAAQVSLAGHEIKTIDFHLIDEGGRPLGPVKFRQNDYSNLYLISLLIATPDRPFRVLARGRDQTGYDFQRIFVTLFQPTIESLPEKTPDPALADLAQSATEGPLPVVRAEVADLDDGPLLSEKGSPIGLRLRYSIRFPRDGVYSPLPQMYPERIVAGYTGALSLKVIKASVDPLPEGLTTAVPLHFLGRATYRAGQIYRFTVDLVPNYALFNESQRSFCLAVKTFGHNSRERFVQEVTSEQRIRFRISILGTSLGLQQPAMTTQTYVPNVWYAGFRRDGATECN